MDTFLIVKTVHILGSTVLFGTGLGIAFFMFASHFTDNAGEKLYAARMTVRADYMFTLPAVIVQPISGAWLVWNGGYGWTDFWLVATYTLYVAVGLCWLPVVWIQIQLKQMLAERVDSGEPLPERYARLFRIWFILGWPAFLGLVAVFYLMVARPA